jgi:radical SAM superfamily enzyme YgiQ (UPF0313 family)
MEALTPKKHKVRVLNELFEKINYDEKIDLVNINITTLNAFRGYKIADEFRRRGITVVLSGWHTSGLPDEAIEHADSVIVGIGENGWLDLLKDYEEGKLKKIYNSDKYLDKNLIPDIKINLPKSFTIFTPVQTMRGGCPNGCEYCLRANILGSSKYILRPIDNIINEIKNLPQKFIIFYDPSMTTKPEEIKKIFKEMKGLGKRFIASGNIDILGDDEEFLKLSREAGCISWLVGFESVSQKTIDTLRKKTNNVKFYENAINKIHKYNMTVQGSFVFGFDTDEPGIFNETLECLKKWEIDVIDLSLIVPFPGTPLFERLEKEKRILTYDWTKYTGGNVIFKPKNMTKDELQNGFNKLVKEIYSRKMMMKRILRSSKHGIYPFFFTALRNQLQYEYMKSLS